MLKCRLKYIINPKPNLSFWGLVVFDMVSSFGLCGSRVFKPQYPYIGYNVVVVCCNLFVLWRPHEGLLKCGKSDIPYKSII